MRRALSVSECLRMKKETFDFEGEWYNAFDKPEKKGVWFVWGNSGNGKSSFMMQLCKELTKYGKVAYNSLEEGDSLSMINMLKRYNMNEVGRNFLLLQEPIEELEKRMKRRKSPDIYVIDSLQYSQLTYKKYIEFKERHPNKLIIFISHASGARPKGRSAEGVMYDASLKIFVEGYKAFSKGRFIGPTGEFTIWQEGADKYWLEGEKK